MSAFRTVIARRPFLTFALLAYALSWWTAPIMQGAILPQGPALAAILVVALTEGRPGLRALWRRCTRWRAGWWFLIGPAIIAAYLLAAFVLNLLLGATVATPPRLPGASVLLMLLVFGGHWEEPGWTGYLLPGLQDRHAGRPNGMLAATFWTGIARSLWHLPLVASGAIPWYDALIFSLGYQIILSWVYNASNGSVPAVMVTHYASNVLAGAIMLQTFSGSDRTTFYVLFIAFAWLIALAILWRSRRKVGYSW
jgi:hypothetical protein